MRKIDLSELERAACKVLLSDPSSGRTAWCRRYLWGIDRSPEAARRFAIRTDWPAGLLAAAYVSFLEAMELPEDDTSSWMCEVKVEEGQRLIAAALEKIA